MDVVKEVDKERGGRGESVKMEGEEEQGLLRERKEGKENIKFPNIEKAQSQK